MRKKTANFFAVNKEGFFGKKAAAGRTGAACGAAPAGSPPAAAGGVRPACRKSCVMHKCAPQRRSCRLRRGRRQR